MALKSTIHKAELQLADLDRAHFGDYALTIARHPSETDERMMVRLLAFALNASATLAFGRGLSAEDEADLQDLDATGSIERWIDVGLPDEKAIRRACNRSRHVVRAQLRRAGRRHLVATDRRQGFRPEESAGDFAQSRGFPGVDRSGATQHAPAMHDSGRHASGWAVTTGTLK